MSEPAIVYLITNTANGKQYVGKTKTSLASRWYIHQRDATKRNSPFAIHRALRKYGASNFKIEMLQAFDSEEDALRGEVDWITKLNTMTPNGYNMVEGGRGAVGFRHSLETRQRMSDYAKSIGQTPPGYDRTGKRDSEESRACKRVAQQKRRAEKSPSPEFYEKCRRSHVPNGGATQTPEARAKRIESMKVAWVERRKKMVPGPTCSVDNCERRRYRRGLCRKHRALKPVET